MPNMRTVELSSRQWLARIPTNLLHIPKLKISTSQLDEFQCRVGSPVPELPQQLDNIPILSQGENAMHAWKWHHLLILYRLYTGNSDKSKDIMVSLSYPKLYCLFKQWFSPNDTPSGPFGIDHVSVTCHSMKPQAASIEGNCEELLEVPAFQWLELEKLLLRFSMQASPRLWSELVHWLRIWNNSKISCSNCSCDGSTMCFILSYFRPSNPSGAPSSSRPYFASGAWPPLWDWADIFVDPIGCDIGIQSSFQWGYTGIHEPQNGWGFYIQFCQASTIYSAGLFLFPFADIIMVGHQMRWNSKP